jgi:hypothetical protein
MDNLIECPCCKSNACSQTLAADGTNVYLCWTCGMTTNDKMLNNSDFEKENYEHTAELIKDLKQVHGDLAWYPKVINLQEKGMVFPEWNKRVQDWYWAAVRATPVTEEEKEKYPDPNKPGEFYKFKMDIKAIKRFSKMAFINWNDEYED